MMRLQVQATLLLCVIKSQDIFCSYCWAAASASMWTCLWTHVVRMYTVHVSLLYESMPHRFEYLQWQQIKPFNWLTVVLHVLIKAELQPHNEQTDETYMAGGPVSQHAVTIAANIFVLITFNLAFTAYSNQGFHSKLHLCFRCHLILRPGCRWLTFNLWWEEISVVKMKHATVCLNEKNLQGGKDQK